MGTHGVTVEERLALVEAELEAMRSGRSGLRFVAGVLRYPNPGAGWTVLNNAGHIPLNITNVTTSTNRVIITYGFTAKKVISLVATPDEYYTQMGISCGASVGLSSAAIYFNRRPNVGYVKPRTLRSNLANIWVLGVFEV
jgi:hypothetical protein